MASPKNVGSCEIRRRLLHSLAEKPLPHFFKIILPDTLKEKKLRIPSKLVGKIGEEVSDIAEVVGPSGHVWQIGLTKEQDDIWFGDGWEKFMEYHSIVSGYLLLFQLRGCSNFQVFIFDSTACEVQYQHSRSARGKELNHGENCSTCNDDKMKDESMDQQYSCVQKSGVFYENARKGGSSKEYNPSPEQLVKTEYDDLEMTCFDDTNESSRWKFSKKNRMSSPHGSLFNGTKAKEIASKSNLVGNELLPKCEVIEIVAQGFAKTSEKSKRAIHAARMFKPKNPAFMVMLKQYNFFNNILYVPIEFVKRHMKGANGYIILQVSNGREWPVQVNRLKAYVTLSRGWHEFYTENNLEEGDVCVFELIDSKDFVLEVSIFREKNEIGPSKQLEAEGTQKQTM